MECPAQRLRRFHSSMRRHRYLYKRETDENETQESDDDNYSQTYTLEDLVYTMMVRVDDSNDMTIRSEKERFQARGKYVTRKYTHARNMQTCH